MGTLSIYFPVEVLDLILVLWSIGRIYDRWDDILRSNFGCLDFLAPQMTIKLLPKPTTTKTTEEQLLALEDDDNDNDHHHHHGYPVQHSGESIGPCRQIDLQVLPEPVSFATLLPPRIIIADDVGFVVDH